MSRNLLADMLAAMIAAHKRPAFLFTGTFADGPVYCWSGLYPLSWDGHTWTGVGTLVGISAIDESADIKGQSCTISCSGLDATMIAKVSSQLQSGAAGSVYLLMFDAAGAIVDAPKIAFRGRLDVGEIDETNPERPVLNLVYEHELARLGIPNESRWTDAEQQRRYPGDTGLSRIAALQDVVITWPA